MSFLFSLAASNAASFNRFSRSAHVKPGVCFVIDQKVTLSLIFLFLAWTFRIASRPLTSGLEIVT